MGNPFFNSGNGQNGNIFTQFQQFMNQMKGQDPNALLSDLVSSGKVNQQQLDKAQSMAKQMQGQFDGMRAMFGFGRK